MYYKPMAADKKDIFLITSVINTGNQAWSHHNTRSLYTPKQRFIDTLETIGSIRDLPSNPLIILVEGSSLDDEMKMEFEKLVDYFLYLADDPEVQASCIQTEKKGYGEIIKTLRALNFLQSNNIVFDRLFKISGRYALNHDFNIDQFSHTEYTFCRHHGGVDAGFTVLYSVPFSLIEDFKDVIRRTINDYSRGPGALEEIMPPKCTPKKVITSLGVYGFIGTCGSYFKL
jgi:hypothetical protein